MGKLLWGSSLSETTGCGQYVPVAIPSRYTGTEMIYATYTDTEMIYATMTKVVDAELLSLPSPVKSGLRI